MRLELTTVHPALHDDVSCSWMLSGPAGPAGRATDERLFPCAAADVIINLGDPILCSTTPGRWRVRPDAWYEALFPRYFFLRPTGRIHLVGIRFRTAQSARYVDAPQSELSGEFVPLDHLYGREARDLESDAREAASAEAAVAHLQAFLLKVRDRRQRRDDGVAEWTARRLVETRGRLGIARLAQEIGVSVRTVERRFLDRVGLTPKRFARIMRLKTAFAIMSSHDAKSLVEVAQAAGYCDQSHMTDEFRELTGLTPSQYRLRENGIHEAFLSSAPAAENALDPISAP